MTEKPRRGNARAEERGVRRSTERCCKTYNSLVRLPGLAGSRGAGLPFCEKPRVEVEVGGVRARMTLTVEGLRSRP